MFLTCRHLPASANCLLLALQLTCLTGCANEPSSPQSDPTLMHNLQAVDDWHPTASGIWTSTIGETAGELRYTDLAAEAPRLERINEFPDRPFPFAPGAVQYALSDDGPIMVRIPCEPGETLYGFGLQLDGVNQTGKVLDLKIDHWGQGRTHAPVPFYLSSRGYGVFFNTARYLTVHSKISNRKDASQRPPEVDRNPPPSEVADQPGPWQAQPPGDAVECNLYADGVEIIVFSGDSLLEVMQRYNLYAGGGTLPPLWGLGFWHRVHAHYDAAQVRAEVEAFAENECPLDVVGLEPGWMSKSYPCTFEWQTERFPDPAALTGELLESGIRLNLWENPYISQHSRLYEAMYPLSGSHLVWLGIVPDYTLPAARKLLIEQHKEDHFDIGISGYKIDEVDGYDVWLWPDHATFPSGTAAEAMRQSYGMQMQQMLYNDLFKANNQRTYGLVRASNGAASAYPFVLYSDSYDHSEYITGISSASLSGVQWTPEVRSADSPREWLNRMQTVSFSPMAKLNGWASGTQPWSFPKVYPAVREALELRMRLLPYLYSAYARYQQDGIPPFRAMILEESYQPAGKVVAGELDGETNPYALARTVETTDQFMFGPSILVAPFYEEQARERSVVLPAGNWYDFHTGAFAGNGETIQVSAEALRDRIPLFVRDGAVIPMLAEPVRQTKEARGADLIVRHYGEKPGTFDLYEDDAATFDYQSGEYRFRRIRVGPDGQSEVTVTGDGPALFGPILETRPMSL